MTGVCWAVPACGPPNSNLLWMCKWDWMGRGLCPGQAGVCSVLAPEETDWASSPSLPPTPKQGGGIKGQWHPCSLQKGWQCHQWAWHNILCQLIQQRQHRQMIPLHHQQQGGGTAAEHCAATTIFCWIWCIQLCCWFLLQHWKHILALCGGALLYTMSIWGNRQKLQLRPTPPLTPRFSFTLLESTAGLCHGGGKHGKKLLPSLQGLEDLASCSGRWRGAAVYAPMFLGYTDCCGSIWSMRSDWKTNFHTLPLTPHSCHSYSMRLPFLLCW